MMRKATMAMMVVSLLGGCSGPAVPEGPAQPTSSAPASIAPSIVSLQVHAPEQVISGLDAQLLVTATDVDGIVCDVTRAVSWSTSNIFVASAAGGRIYANSPGRVTVRATLGEITSSVDVQILDIMIDSLALRADTETAQSGELTAWHVIAHYNNGTTADVTTAALWTSSDPAIATVESPGLVRAMSSGMALVSAWAQGEVASAPLDVTN